MTSTACPSLIERFRHLQFSDLIWLLLFFGTTYWYSHGQGIPYLLLTGIALAGLCSRLLRGAEFDRQAAVPPEELPSREEVAREFARGLQVTLILAWLIALFIHSWSPGRHIEQAGYDLLIRRIAPVGVGTDLPVQVLDISHVGTDREGITDLRPLSEFLHTIGSIRNPAERPEAIGFDVNLHRPGGELRQVDRAFFQHCLDLESHSGGLPRIYLGVAHLDPEARDTWLGEIKYAPLAAYMGALREGVIKFRAVAPVATLEGRTRRDFTYQPRQSVILPTLSVALARAYRGTTEGEQWPPSSGLFPVITPREEQSPNDPEVTFHGQTFLVDYRWLGSFWHRVRSLDSYRLSPERCRELAGKIVILGDVQEARARDAFVVPGVDEPVPGVLVHACAAATLARAPLRQLHPLFRGCMDVVFAALVLSLFAYLKWRYHPARPEFAAHALPLLFLIAGVTVLFLSYLLVAARIIWPDALMIMLALALHAPVEQAWSALSLAAGDFVRALIRGSAPTSPEAKGTP